MYARATLALVVVAGCYRAPAPVEACSITCSDSCPGDLACVNGFCVAEGEVCTPTFQRVSAGAGYACAIDDTGRLWCWGSNAHHQIDGSDRPQLEIATRIGAASWDQISTGGHTCGITDGQLRCWGANDRGQVSGSISGDVTEPFEVVAADGPSRWTSVTTGYSTTCAIGDGRLFCWGAGGGGLLGNGATSDVGAPTPVMTTLADWTAVAIGWRQDSYQTGAGHACAISSSTGLWCWGANSYSQLGDGTTTASLAPVQVALPSPPTSVAAGARSTCATTADQELYCWGNAYDGALGDPALIPATGTRPTPTLASGLPGWTKVTSGERWVCGLRGDEVWCWGDSAGTGVGNGIWSSGRGWGRVTDGVADVSVGVTTNIDDAGANAVDLDLACILVGGEVRCWGDNRYGQLAQGAATQSAQPLEVTGDHRWSAIAAGASHACGIEDGELLCWGSTTTGQASGVASGTTNAPCGAFAGLACDLPAPTPLPFATSITQVALGAAHSCALGDALTCWGDDNYSQLGSSNLPPTPVQIPGAWSTLFATRGHTPCAIRDGETYCWGSFGSSTPPTRIPVLDAMTALNASSIISPGYAGHGCYLDSSRDLFCFGDNTKGQYGNGVQTGVCNSNGRCDAGETSATCPADCGTPPMSRLRRTYRAISVSWGSQFDGAFTCGVLDDGQVECWGINHRWMITTKLDPLTMRPVEYVHTPTPIEGLSGCTAITTGEAFACAMCDGDIWCWGDHRRGQVGAGPITAAPITVPRKIEATLEAGDAWAELAAGSAFACARTTLGRAYCWGTNLHGALGTGAGAANLPVPLKFVR
jgi:alpha-tubulin suppressor-like RCC1 family protein